MQVYVALYSPSSVQKVVDFVKLAYSVKGLIPVILRPIGAGAQIGVPEAYKLSYKLSKPLVVLPEVKDLMEVLGITELLYIDENGDEVPPDALRSAVTSGTCAIMFSSGEMEPSKKELEKARVVWMRGMPRGFPPLAQAAAIIYELQKTNATT